MVFSVRKKSSADEPWELAQGARGNMSTVDGQEVESNEDGHDRGGKRRCASLFEVEVTQPAALRQLIENVSHIIKTVELHIVEEDDFRGIRIETLDDLKVCLVIAQLPCVVTMSEKWRRRSNQSVSLSVERLLLSLRQIDVQYTLIINQREGFEDTVNLCGFEPLTGEDRLDVKCPAMVPLNNGTIKLKEFPVKFTIEMDLHTVRGFFKTCESIKAETVEITVNEYRPPGQESAATVETVTMQACDAVGFSLKRTFKNIKEEDGEGPVGETAAAAAPLYGGGEGECEVAFREAFCTKYLNNFVRSMNRINLTLHMSPGNPLHVSYPLGARDANITFILAPRDREE